MNTDLGTFNLGMPSLGTYLCHECKVEMEHLMRNRYVCPKCSTIFKEKIVF